MAAAYWQQIEQHPALSVLAAERRRECVESLAKVEGFLVRGGPVDDGFPKFVADLLAGVFDAIVRSSIEQMEAYAALLKKTATLVDRFIEDDAGRRCAVRPCQRTLASIVLMGVNRIVVTGGRINARM